ncbi:TD and POZ domain-containing protein 4 [Nephila pilipes]|uniref:TD and POZ domain-containing protein 4 n=1 Tax=Nephila pilipes TaxID=299642 RepID=A0A8X6N9S9_NEPPI|nr:TD and POZ domain-containing protein 4 [Nephila pilipes]
MADDNANRTADLTFFWTIENCPIMLSPRTIKSPIFYAERLFCTRWNLEIKNVDQEFLMYFINRNRDIGPYHITVVFELSFLDSNGSPLNSEKHVHQFMKDNFRDFTLLTDDVFQKRRVEFLANDALSLRCRLWKIQKDTSDNNLCFARTRLGIERLTISWCTCDFSTLPPGRDVIYELKVGDDTYPSLNMALSMSVTNDEEIVLIRFLKSDDTIFHFNYEISVLDVTGKKHFSRKSTILLTQVDRLAHLIRKEELMNDKDLLLPHDVLCLRCVLDIGYGTIWSGIESYTRYPSLPTDSEDSRLI